MLLDNSRVDIKTTLNEVERKGEWIKQPRLNIYRNRTKDEVGKKIVSGFPLNDPRHESIKDPYGYVDGDFIGFMDDNTPVRIRQEPSNRLSNKADRVWFQLRPGFIDVNLTKVQSCTPDKYGYSAFDLEGAKATFTWFTITKVLNGQYPLWANQFELWVPQIPKKKEAEWYAHCFAFVLAENRCVVTKFEKDNPVKGAPEVFVDNPLCPTHPDNFWSQTLQPYIDEAGKIGSAGLLIKEITELYKAFNKNHTKGQHIKAHQLQDEPYFKYFDYAAFLTPHSGLIQIKKYAELTGDSDLLQRFERITALSKEVKEKLYSMLVNDFKYFE